MDQKRGESPTLSQVGSVVAPPKPPVGVREIGQLQSLRRPSALLIPSNTLASPSSSSSATTAAATATVTTTNHALTIPSPKEPATAPVIRSLISPTGLAPPAPPDSGRVFAYPRRVHHHHPVPPSSSPPPPSPRILRERARPSSVNAAAAAVAVAVANISPVRDPAPPASPLSPNSAHFSHRRSTIGLSRQHQRAPLPAVAAAAASAFKPSQEASSNLNQGARQRAAFKDLSVTTTTTVATTAALGTSSNPFANNAAMPFSPTPRNDALLSFDGGGGASARHHFPAWSKPAAAAVAMPPPSPAPAPASASNPVLDISNTTTDEEDDASAAARFPYILGHVVGQGSFAKVFRAIHVISGATVAIKQFQVDENNAQEVREEIALLQKLSHPNLVKCIGTMHEGKCVNVILEYGTRSITQILDEHHREMPENLIRLYTRQLNDALVYLHEQNVFHRDIKGGNVLVFQDGTVKLADLGCSKRLGRTDDTTAAAAESFPVGTVLWMSPEQARQAPDCGLSSDIWSMGATVIEMATGRPPWSERNFTCEAAALLAIANTQEPPAPPRADRFSREGLDFLRACMNVDASKRSSARQLKLHNFFVTKDEMLTMNTARVGVRAERVGNKTKMLSSATTQGGEEALLLLLGATMRALCAVPLPSTEIGFPNLAPSVIVTLPKYHIPVTGLPLLLLPQAEAERNDAEQQQRGGQEKVSGLGNFVERFARGKLARDVHVFQANEVSILSHSQESIWIKWTWKISGKWADGRRELRTEITGDGVCVLDATRERISKLDLFWDPIKSLPTSD